MSILRKIDVVSMVKTMVWRIINNILFGFQWYSIQG